MKKTFFLIVLIGSVIVLPSGRNKYDQLKKNSTAEAKWSGTVTYVAVVNISNAAVTSRSERHITASFTNALPTMYRDDPTTDLNFTDDKGTGSHTYHEESTIIGGQRCVTDCQSSDKAELHAVVINEEENVYDIEVVSPTCIGTTCGENGGTREWGPESQSVIVSNHPLGTSKDILAGTMTSTSELPGGGTIITTTTWNLVRSAQDDVELIVTPANYDSWLPKPGRNERTAGSIMEISLKLQGRNGTTTNKKAKAFELRLTGTSREPGLTINFPVNSTNESADIKFIPQTGAVITDTASQNMKIICTPSRQTANFKIGAYDGGGWTTLTAEAILDDNNRRVIGRLLVSGGEADIRIPKREPNSKIGEFWAKDYGNPQDMDDKETSNGNSHDGDGLTAYEEYRGVVAEGEYKRLNPRKKEVGIDVIKPELSIFSEGINWFENATGLTAVIFHEDLDEIGLDRRLNKNSRTNHDYDQYVLRLYKSTIPERQRDGSYQLNGTGIAGKAYGGPGIPAVTYAVVIDYDENVDAVRIWTNYANSIGMPMPFTFTDYLANTVAHELGHGVNCWHHGPSTYSTGGVINISDRPPVRIFSYNGNEITTRPYPSSGTIQGASRGNQESGDLTCLMAYNPYCEWAYRFDGLTHYFYMVPILPVGKGMCNSPKGTSINKPDLSGANYYFGDASKGNCLSQIKLRD